MKKGVERQRPPPELVAQLRSTRVLDDRCFYPERLGHDPFLTRRLGYELRQRVDPRTVEVVLGQSGSELWVSDLWQGICEVRRNRRLAPAVYCSSTTFALEILQGCPTATPEQAPEPLRVLIAGNQLDQERVAEFTEAINAVKQCARTTIQAVVVVYNANGLTERDLGLPPGKLFSIIEPDDPAV